MKKFLNAISGILFLIGLVIMVGATDLTLRTMVLQVALGFVLCATGFVGLKLGGCKYVE